MARAHPFRTLAAIFLIALIGWTLSPQVVTAAPWSFAVFGDQRDLGSYGINQVIVEKMALEVASKNPAFVLCAGDQIHGHSNDTEAPLNVQYTHWKTAMNPILNISYPVRGNHETYGDVDTPGSDYAKHWMDNIANVLTQIPRNGPPNEVGMSYSFSKDNVFIIGTEQSYATNWYRVNQSWLNDQLKANTLPFTFVYGHYPAFGVISAKSCLGDYPTQRDAFWKSLGDSSINIYFAGHTHLYNRARVSIDGGPEIQQIVDGTGGAPLQSWNGIYPDSRVQGESHQESNYGYTLVTVNGNTITAVYYIYNSTTNTWSAFDTYVFTMTSRKFGANNANQSIEPTTLNDYYQGISIIKIGSGILTLNTGTSTYTDGFTVSGGALNVRGDYSLAPVTVESGASLSGSGAIGNVTNSGTFSPGNSPGTLNVVGNYTQTSSGTLLAEIASSTSYDKINVTGAPGTANLDGTVAPVLLGGYRPLVNQVFPGVVTTTGGVVGTFSNVSQPLTLNWQPVYNANSVDLLFQPNYANPALGLTPNGQAVGNMLQGVAWGNPTGDLATVLNSIDSLPTAGDVRDAYKQISPEKAGALTTLSFASATLQTRNLANRITNLRLAGEGFARGGGLAAAGGLSCNYSRQEGIMLAYNGGDLSSLITGRREKGAGESRVGVFADAGMAFGNQKTTVNQTGFDFTIAGFTGGADFRVKDHLLVGLASGYSHTGSGFHGSGGSVQAHTLPINAYAAYLPGSFYAYGSLGYALNLFDLKRELNFGGLARTAESSTIGHQFNAYGETGYDLRLRPLILTPTVSLSYSRVWVEPFTEQGADSLNLKVAAQDADSLQTGVGGRITLPLQAGRVKVIPQVYASYQHEFSNNSRSLDTSLSQAGSTFTFRTESPKRDFAVLGAAMTVGLKKNLRAQVSYNAEVGRGNYTAHYANAGLRCEF